MLLTINGRCYGIPRLQMDAKHDQSMAGFKKEVRKK